MEYLDELLELKAELEKVLDKERKVLTCRFMPSFIKNLRFYELQRKDELIYAKLHEVELKANKNYEKRLKKHKKCCFKRK